MTQIHSRPGFTPRVTNDKGKSARPSAVTHDMKPIIAKHSTATVAPSNSPLTKSMSTPPPFIDAVAMQAKAEEAFRRMQEEKRKAGPDVIVNPSPSATPIQTSPHK